MPADSSDVDGSPTFAPLARTDNQKPSQTNGHRLQASGNRLQRLQSDTRSCWKAIAALTIGLQRRPEAIAAPAIGSRRWPVTVASRPLATGDVGSPLQHPQSVTGMSDSRSRGAATDTPHHWKAIAGAALALRRRYEVIVSDANG